MKNIRNSLLSILAMGLMSVISLWLLGLLTYFFQWQAPQAMTGITLVYILSGLTGGVLLGILGGTLELRNRIVHGVILGTGYMVVLLLISVLVTGSMNWDITRLLMIWVLLSCSSILGSFLGDIFYKNR